MVAQDNAPVMTDATSSATATTARYTKLPKKANKDSLRWRSTGWTPLAYPASALVNNCNNNTNRASDGSVNPFFPLDKDVLRAAMREMLILDGSIDAKTLKLKEEERMRFQKQQSCDTQMTLYTSAPVYASHVHTWLTRMKKESSVESENTGKKRKLPVSPLGTFSKKKLKKRPATVLVDDKKQLDESSAESDVAVEDLKVPISCAEKLVDLIVERTLLPSDACSVLEPVLSSSDVKVEELFHWEQRRPPRKVSDTDQLSLANTEQPPVLLDLTEETCGDQDISLFVDIHNRKDDGSFAFLKSEIPSILDVSIVFESSLRITAYRMVSKMCQTYDNDAIRLFLGYKSCALKRERVLRILSDYLFDVSHAMFAWKQTESEILSEQRALPSLASFYRQVDSLVSDSLFDQRALKKIGGLDDSSILRHAIEISRSERKQESWERFSTTATGRRLLSHHRAGRAHLVGQKRRGQRIKRATDNGGSEDAPRSRASSIGSYSEEDVLVMMESSSGVPEAMPTTACATATVQEVALAATSSTLQQQHQHVTIQNLSEVLDLVLTRSVGKSWGVLLSKEGDHCVVDRAPEDSTLRCGDMILSVKNDRNDEWKPSPNRNPDWFKEIVGFFKGSNALHLVVRRVGC